MCTFKINKAMDLTTYRDTKERGAMRRLAERAQLRPTYLSHIVCGRRGLSWEMAERIAAADESGELRVEDILRGNADARKAFVERHRSP